MWDSPEVCERIPVRLSSALAMIAMAPRPKQFMSKDPFEYFKIAKTEVDQRIRHRVLNSFGEVSIWGGGGGYGEVGLGLMTSET